MIRVAWVIEKLVLAGGTDIPVCAAVARENSDAAVAEFVRSQTASEFG
jgi:hypothetical protein